MFRIAVGDRIIGFCSVTTANALSLTRVKFALTGINYSSLENAAARNK